MSDFLVANFDGAGTLSGYTPDTGGAITALGQDTPGTLAGWGTPALTVFPRTGAGAFEIPWNASGLDFLLVTATAPAGANYFAEITLDLSTTKNTGSLYSLAMRGTTSIYSATVMRCVAAMFDMEETSLTDRSVTVYSARYYDDTAPGWVTEPASGVVVVQLGAATSVVFRAEVEGNVLRTFVDGVLVLTSTWSGTTEYDAAGRPGWGFHTNWFGNADPNIAETVDQFKAGDTFIVPPGNFWTNFVRSTEVDA